MKIYGIDINLKNVPSIDKDFAPIGIFNKEYLKGAEKPVGIAVERANGEMASVNSFIYGTEEMKEADCYYIDRLVKTLLWMKGGYKIYVSGDKMIYDYLCSVYKEGGAREFDYNFMAGVYEKDFEVIFCDKIPNSKDAPEAVGGHLDGCRIGFDAGGSDRKVSAVINGESVYDEEVVWFPKINSDPDYHYDGIVSALKSAAEHLPRVDAVGVSSAGIYIKNRAMVASLFLKVPKDDFEAKVKNIYIRAVKDTFGDIPLDVANDGDVTALAGMMSLGEPNVLGIAMGTSEAGGFVDADGKITGWLNELAFVPVDANPDAMIDEWSGDIGCGVKYFSQDSVIKLAEMSGITFDADSSPAERLKRIQAMMEADNDIAKAIYNDIGIYLGHTLAYYYDLYGMKHVLLLGRVMSGKGGDIVLSKCKEVLADEYPQLSDKIYPALPDEKFRRVGQSAVAASLPEIK